MQQNNYDVNIKGAVSQCSRSHMFAQFMGSDVIIQIVNVYHVVVIAHYTPPTVRPVT